MFGKKDKYKPEKLTAKQKFGLGLINSIADNLLEIVNECEDYPRSQYAMEVGYAVDKLHQAIVPAHKKIKEINQLPFDDIHEVRYE